MRRNFIPDQTLTDQLGLDNTDAFEELYLRYWFSLYSYSFGKLKSHNDAKRIVTNVFASLWEKRAQLPVTFSLSAYLYAEVRSEVVKCVNSKLNTDSEEAFIEQKIIPGFSSRQLAKAKRPVSYKETFLTTRKPQIADTTNHSKEGFWEKYYSRHNFKGIKHAFQTMLNF